jgi:hypothetical protein
MFKHYTKNHNNGIFLGFTKPSECRMVGEQIALTCLLRLRDALKSTINSKEFMDLNNFKPETFVLNNNNFWLYLFVMCCALYAPMRVLHLADQQVPGMEKLYYYVLQIDRMLLRWLPDAEIRVSVLHRDGTYNAMTNMDEYVFDEEATDSSSDDDKEEDSDDDDDRLVRDDNVDNDADEESEDNNSLLGANVISLQE